MNGGEISGNETKADGGGVYVGRGARFTMTGGTIKSNRAARGGGVAMEIVIDTGNNYDSSKHFQSKFSKTGGTIYGDNDIYYSRASNNNTSTGGKGHAVYVYDYVNGYVDKAVRNTMAGKNDAFSYNFPAQGGKSNSGWDQ
jgi:hypothetical protein